MKFFSFVSGKTIDMFAKDLAGTFAQSCPLARSQARDFDKQVGKALDGIYEKAREFRRERHIGIFRRARLAKKFQDELLRLGYDSQVVNKVTAALVANALAA